MKTKKNVPTSVAADDTSSFASVSSNLGVAANNISAEAGPSSLQALGDSQIAINITDSYQNQHSYDSSFYEQQQYDYQGLSHSSFEEKIGRPLIQAFHSILEEILQSAISSLTGP
ncbi:hypothetical protein OUZ56_018849 [Daphnia magna]|uniref:Uncharacterized protein n=1 Tax=Daphnia magna TaxID=35525 RepID=A0ABQ9Z9W9_9CRUS|nr:hypothetical protein OUZ56_018849 [Daphnia magna]